MRTVVAGVVVWLGFALVLVNRCDAIAVGQPEVTTGFGPIRGLWMKTARGAQIAGFLGVPYAMPPVEEFRFEDPRPWFVIWNEARNATADKPMCLQKSKMDGIIGDEDCLYLNIFTPTLSKDQNEAYEKKLPVLVFIHGGSFRGGSSNSSLFAPTYLLDHEIILVTLNYRLNVLGFFSTGNDVAPGNFGLKDITVALRWIKSNIEDFGGDPNSVTLAGQSSGAAIAQLLSASEATEGLFHKLITMSGSALAPWAFHSRENIRNSSMYVANLVGCNGMEWPEEIGIVDDPGSGDGETEAPTTTVEAEDVETQIDQRIVQCLKKVDARDIVEKGSYDVWRRNPQCIFGPTLEAEASGAILTVHPERSLSEGLFRDMPWITGVTNDEGLLKTTDLFLNQEIKDELIQDYARLLPYVLEMNEVIDNTTAVVEAIEDFYFNGDIRVNLDTNATQLVGDALITWASYEILQNLIGNMKSNVYFYVFSYEGTFSTTFRWGIPFRFGAAHGDDVNYIFPYLNAKYADLQLFNTMGDRTMINIMSEMWVNFAKTGVPSARLTSSWEPYQTHRRFMRFGDGRSTDRTMEEDFLPERMEFWQKLLTNYSLPITEYRVDDGELYYDDIAAGAGTAFVSAVFYVCAAILSCYLV